MNQDNGLPASVQHYFRGFSTAPGAQPKRAHAIRTNPQLAILTLVGAHASSYMT